MKRADIVDRAIAACRELVSERVPGIEASINSVFWYGAVDIAPEHCVVWVILAGGDEGLVPAWYSPGDDAGPFPQFARGIVARIKAAFADAGWSAEWPSPTILFESDRRVREGGGWFYFK